MSDSNAFRVSLGLVVALLGVVSAGCGDGSGGSAPQRAGPTITTEILVAAADELPTRVEASGSVEPWTRANPGTKIMGRIEVVSVREGDPVRRGQLLARLEQRDLSAAVEQAAAAVSMAQAELENASAQSRRMQTLHERGSTTDKSVEDATARFRIATAAAEQARAKMAAAEVMLSYAEIRSPLSGWVAAKLAEAGDMTSPGMPLFTLEDRSKVKINVSVPESDVVTLKPGDEGKVIVDVFDETWTAEIARIMPAGDPRSRTFEVQLVLDNPDGRLKSGMFARAVFERGSRPALLVPTGSVVTRGQLRGLFVIDSDGRARLRWVRLGRAGDDRVEVLSGLAAGEHFVAAPPPELTDGALVERG